jgi:branched-chain amino acid transport system permease protein
VSRTAPALALLLALALLASLPLWIGNSYYVNVAAQVLLYAVFALGLNVIVGWAGLVSLGHAGLFGIAAYSGAILINAGQGHFIAIVGALAVTLGVAALFAVLALRGTGLGFVMITVALGQIVWGVAYRWISLTNGDNGVSITSRPAPFGLSLAGAEGFYWGTLVVFLVAVGAIAVFAASPFGASLRGTRDQPRRMNALGYNVWLIRFLAFLLSGFWSGVAGLLFLYYNQFISPQAVALTASAEVLLMVIAGGTATLLGPIAGALLVVVIKNVASTYVERWNFVLGAIFVAIVIFMPEGLVPGSARLWRWGMTRVRPRLGGSAPVAAAQPGDGP